jgi:phosphoglycerate kinase
MTLRTIGKGSGLRGKRVLLRVDFNIPAPKGGKIGSDDDMRIRAALPTIERLRASGAKLILVSHLGRPDGKAVRALSLAPVAAHLASVLGTDVRFVKDDLRKAGKVERSLADLAPGGVAMLENIRFYPEEEKNGARFAKRLASLADVYVSDAFAACHRAHASTVGVAKYLPAYAGLLVEGEVRHLGRLLNRPKRPFVILLGGAKVSTKLPTLVNLLRIADRVLLGGGIANGFLAAKGLRLGKTKVDPADVRAAKKLLGDPKIVLPADLLVSRKTDGSAPARAVSPDGVMAGEYVLDVGTSAIREFAAALKKAKTIVWNGPLGKFEIKKFSHGSVALGRVIAARSSGNAFGVVGGGETVACLALTGMAEHIDHVSTGGGAMLEFLSGKTLPGIAVLQR